jgi:predicted RNase H-like HicB family nuclease
MTQANHVIGRVSGKMKCMKLKAIIHQAEEGGYWAEVPSIEGCVTQGDTFEELLGNLDEAVEGCMSVDLSAGSDDPDARVMEAKS